MGNQTRRLEAVERALALLLAKERYFILIRAGDTPEEAAAWHREQGLYDPEKQEPFFIMSRIPGKIRHSRHYCSNADLPEVPLRKAPEPTPLPPHEPFEMEAPVKPKPPKRTRIVYPEQVY